MAFTMGVIPSGSARFKFAPAPARIFSHSTHANRAAQHDGARIRPAVAISPGARRWSACPDFTTVEMAFTHPRRRRSTCPSCASRMPSALGGGPHQGSLAVPAFACVHLSAVGEKNFRGIDRLPVRATVISGVSSSVPAALASAPALRSFSTMAAFPLMQASERGDAVAVGGLDIGAGSESGDPVDFRIVRT